MKKYVIVLYLIIVCFIGAVISLAIITGKQSNQLDLKDYAQYFPGNSIHSGQCDSIIWHSDYYSAKENYHSNFSCIIRFTGESVISVSLTVQSSDVISYTILNFDAELVQLNNIVDDYSTIVLKPYRKYTTVYYKNILTASIKYILRPTTNYNWRYNMGSLYVKRPYVLVLDNMLIYTTPVGVSQLIIRSAA